MEEIELHERSRLLVTRLTAVWEASVRATHLFLSGEEIEKIKQYVPQALCDVTRLIVETDKGGLPVAFMGINERKIEMLFVAPEERGKGIGKRLIWRAIDAYGIDEVCVNEQNPQAKGFYEYAGFKVYKRTERDEQGAPYPLLYMKLEWQEK